MKINKKGLPVYSTSEMEYVSDYTVNQITVISALPKGLDVIDVIDEGLLNYLWLDSFEVFETSIEGVNLEYRVNGFNFQVYRVTANRKVLLLTSKLPNQIG